MNKTNRCRICGKPINLEDFDKNREIPKLMKAQDLCFQCAFWFNRLDYDKELEKEGKIAVIARRKTLFRRAIRCSPVSLATQRHKGIHQAAA